MNKIEALNSLEVIDYSCSGGECEYILAENTEEARLILIEAGFTEEEIKEANDNNDNEIDLSYLAFNNTKANWWMKGKGFCIEDAPKSTESHSHGVTEAEAFGNDCKNGQCS